MFNRGGKKRDLREIISKAPNFNERAKFPSRIKTLFDESFQGSRKQFQSKRLVMSRTDVYVTADLYQTKRQDKPRIVWRYKINSHVLGNRKSSRVSCSIAEETRETYERLSQRPQTLMNAQNFLVELKPCLTKVFKDHESNFRAKD